jgi:DNA-directed RNA polymerase I subunit RPA1
MTNFLQWEGFTLGVKDVLVTAQADELRRHYMVEASKVGPKAAAAGVSVASGTSEESVAEKLEQVHRSRDNKQRAFVDLCYKQSLDQYVNQINKSCLPHGLVAIFPHNNLQLLVQSGAKGSTVNTMQMSCALGQIELEGKRPPLSVSGKSLPSFKAYDVSPRAGGFIAGRFLTGIRPQEFFFHCMAGREVSHRVIIYQGKKDF